MLAETSCCHSWPRLRAGVLAHEEQHGYVVGVAAGDGGEAVGGAGAGAGHGDAHLAGGAGVAVGNLNAEALVAGGKGPDAGAAQWPPEGSQAAAGESGYVTYSFLFEGFDNGFGSTHGGTSPWWGGFPPSSKGGHKGRPYKQGRPRGSPLRAGLSG